jgi:hypothetical protein
MVLILLAEGFKIVSPSTKRLKNKPKASIINLRGWAKMMHASHTDDLR